jgi:uncharacterized protein (TIGR02118 family)
MMKLTVLFGQPADPEQFESYYARVHLPLAAKMPGVSRLELTKFTPGAGGAQPPYYRMAEIYFASEEQMHKTLRSAEGRAAAADIPNFASGGATFLNGAVSG